MSRKRTTKRPSDHRTRGSHPCTACAGRIWLEIPGTDRVLKCGRCEGAGVEPLPEALEERSLQATGSTHAMPNPDDYRAKLPYKDN